MRYSRNIMITVLAIMVIVSSGTMLFAAEKASVENLSYEEYLIKSLQDENIGRRASAARILGEQNNQVAVRPLMDMLKSEKDFRVRIVAAVSINNLGDPSVVPALKKIWKNERNKTAKQVLGGVITNLKSNFLTSSN